MYTKAYCLRCACDCHGWRLSSEETILESLVKDRCKGIVQSIEINQLPWCCPWRACGCCNYSECNKLGHFCHIPKYMKRNGHIFPYYFVSIPAGSNRIGFCSVCVLKAICINNKSERFHLGLGFFNVKVEILAYGCTLMQIFVLVRHEA